VKITPLELRKPDFKKSFRGFSPDEVLAMLSSAAEALEELIRENKELQDQNVALKDKLKGFRDLENTLNETLILAQKASDSTRQAAQREAELITARAEVEAEKMLENARARMMALKLEIEELEHQKQAYLLRLRSLVASQWKLLQEEREEEEKLRELATAVAQERVPGGGGETLPVEEAESFPEEQAGEKVSEPEAVSEELGEILEEASAKDKKKGKGGKRAGARDKEEENTLTGETGSGPEKDAETPAAPNLFWEEDSSGEELAEDAPGEPEDSDK